MAEVNRELIEQLVKRPGESLVVELKTWISPEEPAGQAKIVRAVFALRNRGGGHLVIGIDDKTLQSDHANAPANVRALFHIDNIQALVARYASEPFEIGVEFVEHDGLDHPVIVVPVGVRTPVAAKADLKVGDKHPIRINEVYVRTLSANNSASTAAVTWKDWRDLMEICFDNREADIGRFLRRHLAGVNPATIAAALAGPGANNSSVAGSLEKLMEEGRSYFHEATAAKQLELPTHGAWEVALMINGELPEQESLVAFARLLSASNPGYTGWPMWHDARGTGRQEWRPYVTNGAWHTFIVATEPGTFRHIEFMLESPNGCFYSYRALEDDLSESQYAPQPGKALDVILPVLRVWEAIAVGLAFAKALEANDQASLQFMFRWSGLSGRELNSWADNRRYVSGARTARQDVVTSKVSVPLEAPVSAQSEYVRAATRPLYEVFDGFSISSSVIEEATQSLVSRGR